MDTYGYEENLRGVQEAAEIENRINVELRSDKSIITMRTTINDEGLRLIQKKYKGKCDLDIVRGPNNTINISGFGDQVEEHQDALLEDVRTWDRGATY